MDINKYIKPAKKDVFHTSAYAKVAKPGIGSTSSETFARRRFIDRRRSAVGHYGASKVGRSDTEDVTRMRLQSPLRKDATPLPRRAFSEPPKRDFNPYR